MAYLGTMFQIIYVDTTYPGEDIHHDEDLLPTSLFITTLPFRILKRTRVGNQ